MILFRNVFKRDEIREFVQSVHRIVNQNIIEFNDNIISSEEFKKRRIDILSENSDLIIISLAMDSMKEEPITDNIKNAINKLEWDVEMIANRLVREEFGIINHSTWSTDSTILEGLIATTPIANFELVLPTFVQWYKDKYEIYC